ncbi:MAG: transcription elongation factor GreA [Anaerolineales bacterium]
MANQVVYLTKKGRKKLEDELTYLLDTKRQEVANRLHEAMEDGELIENAEYEAAKNEQAFVEGRILEIEYMLASAQEIKHRRATDMVLIGSTVEVKQDGSSSETYTIVGAAEASPKEGLISNESPLGQALLQRKVGDDIQVEAPAGVLNFRIVKIK